jgi:predicted nuclease of predicted toxin-antitoxin system
MRVLIDACLPVQFKRHLPFPGARTARELGWQNKKNGDLLALAQHEFDVLLTMDKRIPRQQWLSRFSIAVLIIRARSNRLDDLLPLVPVIVRMVSLVKKGQALVVSR